MKIYTEIVQCNITKFNLYTIIHMKKILISIATIALISFNANAGEVYKLDPHHSSVDWKATHFGFSSPSGKFSEIEGTLNLDEKHPTSSFVNITVKMDNLFTGYVNFDNHLKSADFFNVEKYPTATFKSTKVVITGKNTAKVYGDLTMVGVTKNILLNVKLNKIGVSPITQKKTAGFSGTAVIKRSEFKIDYAIPAVGDLVKLTIESEANLDGDEVKKVEEKK